MKISILDRFERYCRPDPNSGCWLWAGDWNRDGYGVFRIQRHRHVGAHRVSWTLHRGPIPDGMSILHKCDVRCCVNPDHLYIGDQAKNVNDMMNRGRWGGPTGERHHKAKLSREQVFEIRSRTESIDVLAPIYGVDRTTIARIRSGRIWKHEHPAA